MSEHALKYEKIFFNESYTQKLFIAFKMTYFCCVGLRGNLDFPRFLQKMFYNINCWSVFENENTIQLLSLHNFRKIKRGWG